MASRKSELTHVDKDGRARMVDVTSKAETVRVARAEALVEMSAETVELLTGVVFGLVGAHFGADWALPAYLLFAASLIALSAIDLEHFRLLHLGLGTWFGELVQDRLRARARPLLRNAPGYAVPILVDTGEVPARLVTCPPCAIASPWPLPRPSRTWATWRAT